MTLEQGYFVSQIIAAGVLIASIIFLALQIRQNSRFIERLVNEDHRSSQTWLFDQIIQHRDFAQFHRAIGEDYDSLDELDKYRAHFIAQKNIQNTMRSVQAKVDGDLPDREWKLIEGHIRYVTTRKNVQETWSLLKNRYSKEAQKLWEQNARGQQMES